MVLGVQRGDDWWRWRWLGLATFGFRKFDDTWNDRPWLNFRQELLGLVFIKRIVQYYDDDVFLTDQNNVESI